MHSLGLSIGPGVEFDHGCTKRNSGFNLIWVRIDEETDDDPLIAQRLNGGFKAGLVGNTIKPSLRSDLFTRFGNEANIGRQYFQRNRQDLWGISHFEIELG